MNENLKQYKKWDEQLDALIAISVSDPSIVFDWREQAEAVRREAGEGAMTKEEVKKFCDRYMPSYFYYLDYTDIESIPKDKTLRFMLSPDRKPYLKDENELEALEKKIATEL